MADALMKIVIAIGFIGGIVIGVIADSVVLGVILAFVLPAIIIGVLGAIAKQSLEKDKQKEQAANFAERQRFLDSARNGSWSFPKEEFYEECKTLTHFENDYAIQKAKLIATKILASHDIPEDAFHNYTSNECLLDYLGYTKAKVDQEIEAARLRTITPQKARLDGEQFGIKAYNTPTEFGLAKRIYMINQMIKKVDIRINQINSANAQRQQAAMQLAYVASKYSALTQQKTNDWAVAGGIASGLAGPIAGIAAATSAIAENARIEEQNRRNRETINNAAAKALAWGYSGESTEQLEKEKDRLEKLASDQATKIVFDKEDYPTDMLFRVLDLSAEITTASNHALKIKCSARYNGKPIKRDASSLPPDIPITIDGALKVDIFNGKIHVGDCYLNLPLFGIEVKKDNSTTTKLEGVCEYYLEGNPSYSAKVSPHKLWLMEI